MFLLTTASSTTLGAHLASYPMGTGGSYTSSKAARREADHSPPCSAVVELYLHFHIRLHGVVLS